MVSVIYFLVSTFQGAPNKLGQCSTCHGSFAECPGHLGYLKLAPPVFNVAFFNCILDVLKCICKVLPLRSLCHGHVACVVILILFSFPSVAAGFFLWRKTVESFWRRWEIQEQVRCRKVLSWKKWGTNASYLAAPGVNTETVIWSILSSLLFLSIPMLGSENLAIV
jgi:hypothetical protein